MKTTAIILAAGKGKRLAALGPKPLLKIDNTTFIEMITTKIVEAGFDDIIVVTNKYLAHSIKNLVDESIRIVINQKPEAGMLSSLQCGMEVMHVYSSALLLQPVDFPLVRSRTYKKLLKAHHENCRHIIIPAYAGRRGHPVIFPANTFDQLMNAPLSQGARYVVRQKSNSIMELNVTDSATIVNINTPDVYAAYCTKNHS